MLLHFRALVENLIESAKLAGYIFVVNPIQEKPFYFYEKTDISYH